MRGLTLPSPMLHWAKSFGAIALIAGAFALAGLPDAFAMLAGAMLWLFAALAGLALFTGAFGRGRDGLYSFERALTLVGAAAGVVVVSAVWLGSGWTAEDAGRALDGGVAELVRVLRAGLAPPSV